MSPRPVKVPNPNTYERQAAVLTKAVTALDQRLRDRRSPITLGFGTGMAPSIAGLLGDALLREVADQGYRVHWLPPIPADAPELSRELHAAHHPEPTKGCSACIYFAEARP